jgi:predicted transcriptional regulator
MGDDILAQPTRQRIYEIVGAHPGASARDVQRLAGLAWGETAYHLDQLIRAGALRRERGGRRDYYFRLDMTWEDRRVLLTLRSRTERQILLALVDSPGLNLNDLKERTQTSLSTVSTHLRRLVALGVVESERTATTRQFRAVRPDRVSVLVRQYRESFRDRLVDRFVETWSDLLG